MYKLIPWEKLKNGSTDRLLVGNGGSMAVDEEFSYKNLYEVARKSLQTKSTSIIETLEGSEQYNFETALRHLTIAVNINLIIKKHDGRRKLTGLDLSIKRAYKNIRMGLIKSVSDVHPEWRTVKSKLNKIRGFTNNFSEIFSLNYDLLIYWMMLLEKNESESCIQYKDFF